MTERRGAYVTFDGGEGVGKSTQVRRFGERLGIKVVREPGETPFGHEVRRILLNPDLEATTESELFLFSADRHNTLQTVTLPHLRDGKSVLSDRSYLSTMAYQCYGGGLSLDYARQVTKLAIGTQLPDKQVIFDIDPAVAYERMHAAGKDTAGDRFESRDRAFHEKVRKGFLELAHELGSRALVIDASGTPDELHAELSTHLDTLLIEGVAV